MYPSAAHAPGELAGGAYCGRDGRFGLGVPGLNNAGYGPATIGRFNEYFVQVLGVDTASSTYIAYSAPKGSQVFSPTTSLALYAGNQSAVKQALGLDNGLFALQVDRDLTTFNPVAALGSSDAVTRADGERILAANLRVLAATIPFSGTSTYFGSPPRYEQLGSWVGSHSGFLFTNTRLSDYLTSRLSSSYDPRVVSAMAHLVNAYAAAIPVRVGDEATARQFMLGIHGYLDLEIRRLLRTNSVADADAALAVTAPQILAATQIFREAPAFPTAGHFFPAPDFFETSGNSIAIQADETGTTGSSGSLASNDLFAQGTAEGNGGFFPTRSTVAGVSVPPAYASSIDVVLSANAIGNAITVTSLAGFRGRAWFDYTVRHPSGQTGSARVYLHFR